MNPPTAPDAPGPTPAPAGGPPDRSRRSGRRRAFFWILVCSLAIAAVLGGVRTERRVEHDAAFCATSCHHTPSVAKGAGAHHTEGWAAGGHGDLECQGCHATPITTGLTLLWQSFAGSKSVTAHGKEAAATCTSCHEKRPAEWRAIAETKGHREHRGLKGIDCLSCHASSAHSSVTPAQTCLSCHEDQTLHSKAIAGAETCLSCHAFAVSSKNTEPPTPVSCTKCHADSRSLLASAAEAAARGVAVRPMKDVNEHSLHGGVACQLCHNAHGKKLEPPPGGGPVCGKCHQVALLEMKDTKGPEAHRQCEGCHKPHAPRESALQSCAACHEKNVIGLTAAGREKTTALRHESCASCHVPHTWRAEPSGCAGCHKKEATLVATRSPEQHSACTTCHEIHGPPPTGAVCLKCHEKTQGSHLALAPERHKDCTSCHDPHAPRPEDTRASCTKCHAAEQTQVTLGPEGHAKAGCFGCHQPHGNPLPAPGACAKCHAERATAVASAGPEKHRVCTSCHEKHDFRVAAIVPTCAKCHGPMFETAAGTPRTVSHRGDCKTCHELHGSPAVAKTACLKCHQDVEKAFHPPNAKHADCRSCHEPHAPAATAPARCATCHEAKAAVAAKWVPGSPHAQACTGCHEAHDARVKTACATCHAKEAASALGGKHECTQCHAPHKEPPGTGHAWWSRCNDCHADKVTSVKLRGPVHADCKSCHEPHRFGIPSCTTCHQDIRTKGLHAVEKHAASCTSCHDPHVRSDPKPPQCLTCHTDRRNHEPNAQKCQACHLFK